MIAACIDIGSEFFYDSIVVAESCHGGTGGVEGMGTALIGHRIIMYGGTTQKNYAELSVVPYVSVLSLLTDMESTPV
jgi:hypothetical protein